jgi:ATP-dependent RNA helicase DeaD
LPLEISKVFPDPPSKKEQPAAAPPRRPADEGKRASIYESAAGKRPEQPAAPPPRARAPEPRARSTNGGARPVEPPPPAERRPRPPVTADRDDRPRRAERDEGRDRDRDRARDDRPARDDRGAPPARRPAPRDDRRDESEERAPLNRAQPPRSNRRERRHDGEASRAAAESQRLESQRLEPIPADGDFGGKFKQFEISPPVLKAIHDMGWRDPSEIQEKMIPLVLKGGDVVGQAKTGTGKTGAFAIPTVDRYRERAEAGERGRGPVVLVLAPTRELAMQVHDQVEHLAVHTKVKALSVYGGSPMEPQLRGLRAGVDFVVGTPGRIMDHVRRGSLKLDSVRCLVLDEADRMFDLGFRDDIYWISRRLPNDGRQTLLLSATINDEVLKLAHEVTQNPEEIYTAPDELTVGTVEQFYVAVDPERKLDLLVRLIEDEKPEKGIVFTRTKRGADKVAEKLRQRGQDAGEIHGDLKQKRREDILERFREGGLHLMVATDVAARGLDIQGVTHIFNFDVPENPEDYVHRVGRTARMGKSGRAFMFITHGDGDVLTSIEKLINKVVVRFEVEGFRVKATTDEQVAESGRPPMSDHPLAKKLSPALLQILNDRRGKGGPRGGGGGRGGPRPGGRGGPPRGGGRSGGGRGGGRGR